MAGGGTGGHVVPSLAVAEKLKEHGHDAVFVGTKRGVEATLVPRRGFPIEWIDIGGLQRVGALQTLKTMVQLPWSVLRCTFLLQRWSAAGVFSMGGYVAAPVMLAARLLGLPVIAMEPNAMPGLVTRKLGWMLTRVLIGFPEAARWFPRDRTELTGLPVREEFFRLPDRAPSTPFQVLITGGSRGSHALNRGACETWALWKSERPDVRIVLQSGAAECEDLRRAMKESGASGEVVPFIEDMPAAYAQADLVVSRSGAGAVSELAAAGKPSLLVPFPYATDDHQRHNAESMAHAGAARMILEQDWNGTVLARAIDELREQPEKLRQMSGAARSMARPGAAKRAAELLLEAAAKH